MYTSIVISANKSYDWSTGDQYYTSYKDVSAGENIPLNVNIDYNKLHSLIQEDVIFDLMTVYEIYENDDVCHHTNNKKNRILEYLLSIVNYFNSEPYKLYFYLYINCYMMGIDLSNLEIINEIRFYNEIRSYDEIDYTELENMFIEANTILNQLITNKLRTL